MGRCQTGHEAGVAGPPARREGGVQKHSQDIFISFFVKLHYHAGPVVTAEACCGSSRQEEQSQPMWILSYRYNSFHAWKRGVRVMNSQKAPLGQLDRRSSMNKRCQ